MQGIVKDALEILAITPLAAVRTTAAATVNGTERVMASMPLAVAAVLMPIECPAAHTLDIKIQGRNGSSDSWVDLVTFTQVTNAAQAIQRASVGAPYKRYRAVYTTAGAYGAGEFVTFELLIVGTNAQFKTAGLVQVD